MSNNRIFASGIRQEPMQGRSANLTGRMMKRSPIFNHVPPQKQQNLTPFANYNCRSSESLYTSQSQTTINDERMTTQIISKIVKEELIKFQSQDSSKKQFGTIQAQLNDIKERIIQYEQSYDKRLLEIKASLKGEIKEQTNKMGQQISTEILTKLRTFFQMANIQMKNDILASAQQQFLSMNYGDDLESRLQAFNQRIQALNNLIATNNNISSAELHQKLSSVISNEQYEPKLAKMEKDIESFKKTIQEHTGKTKKIEQKLFDIEQKKINQNLSALQDKYKSLETYQGNFTNNFNKLQEEQNELKRKLETSYKSEEEMKIQIADLHKNIRNQYLKNNELKTYLTQSNNFQTSVIVNNSSNYTEFNKNSSNSSEASELKEFKKIETAYSAEFQEQNKMTYQIDSDGYLMDGQCRYLLTESGEMIKLDNGQIKALLQSNLVQIIDK